MYENILIPYDGSNDAKRGAEHGTKLAAALGATVHGVYVVEEGTNPWMTESSEDQLDRAKEWGRDQLQDVGEMAEDEGVEFVSEVLVGPSVSEQVNEYAEEEGVDAIIVGSGYYGRIGGILGSVADKIVRTAAVPVITLRRGEQG